MSLLSPVTIITPSGGRPEAFSLCQKYVERQDYGEEIQWIVIDDGEELEMDVLESTRLDIQRVFPIPRWKPGQNTLARNLLAAIPFVKHEIVLVVENDDWYISGYVAEMAAFLEEHELVGEGPACYYHLPTAQYRDLGNRSHASLCQTAMRKNVLPLLADICRERDTAFIDVRLWERFQGSKVVKAGRSCVGMKGLPGRMGIGVGHHPERIGGWSQDPDGTVLASWVGDDSALYSRFKASEGAGGYNSPTQTPPTCPSEPHGPKNDVLGASLGVQSAPEPQKPPFEGFQPPEAFPSQTDFEEFFFMGQRRYKCNQFWESGAACEYDTYDLQGIIAHIREPHNRSGSAAPRKVVRRSPILDAKGEAFAVEDEKFSNYQFKRSD